MSNDDKVLVAVDRLADAIDPDDLLDEAGRLGLTVEELLHRVSQELIARVEGS